MGRERSRMYQRRRHFLNQLVFAAGISVMVQDAALQNEVLDIGLHWLQEQIGFAPELEPVAAAYSGLIALTIPPGER